MSIADKIRIMRGFLTDEERMERDITARARRVAAEANHPETHNARVRLCAGLSAVVLQCHPDTWRIALRAMSGPWLSENRWENDPSDALTDGPEGLVQVRLSGARLAELMSVLWHIPPNRRTTIYNTPKGMEINWKATPTPAEEAQAVRLYHAIAPIVDRVNVNSPRSGDLPIVTIDDAVEEYT